MSIDDEAMEFDTEKFIAAYRRAIQRRKKAARNILSGEMNLAWMRADNTAGALRFQWSEWQGEDSLHEFAFGEPDL